MPVRIARSAPLPSFGLPALLVAIHTSRLNLAAKAGRREILYASSDLIRGNHGLNKECLVHWS